ncbi:UNVERIFIED_CONTAM: hypothetical protein GTU68_021386, partial [Idotea baltica]|nr:hypothetical protein [Idotea baltica]
FNRGRLLNVGFVESLQDGPFDCFIFHNIDLLPKDGRHLYHCSFMPRHLVVTPNNYTYALYFTEYFGGASSMTEEHFWMVNGYSNKYWGWGKEDEDIEQRIWLNELVTWRYHSSIARYTVLSHKKAIYNHKREEEFKENIKNYKEDGLNSLEYDLVSKERKTFFTSIKVNFTTFFKNVH